MGARAVLRQHPHQRSKKVAWSPAPLIHAASPEARLAFRNAYGELVARYREAAHRLRAGARDVSFPPGFFPPPLPFVRAGPVGRSPKGA